MAMQNDHLSAFDSNAMLQAEIESLADSSPVVQHYLWFSRWHLHQALQFAVRAYIDCSIATNHEDGKVTAKRTRMAVREEVLKLSWPYANLDTSNKLDVLLKAEVKAHGLPKDIEDELLSQLSNGQKKMCEQKLHGFIKSPVFDKLVEHQLPSYLKSVQKEPSKFTASRAEIIHKLRQAASFLTDAIPKSEDRDCKTDEVIATTGKDATPVVQREHSTSSEVALVPLPSWPQGWQVKNTFIDTYDDVQDDPTQTRDTKSCLAGCWSHHAQQRVSLPGRAGSVGEVASHREVQSVSKWEDYGDWTVGRREFKQAAPERASMSPALLNILISALDHSENAAEVALHISENVQVLDASARSKAVKKLQAQLGRAKEGEDCEVVLKAIAACTMLEFLDHSMVHDRNSMQYSKVAGIFSDQLSAEQFSEKELPKLLQIVMLHWPLQNDAACIIIDSCVRKILEVYQTRGVILGMDVSTGQAAQLLDEGHHGIADLFHEGSASQHCHSYAKLFVRTQPLPRVMELLLASDRPGDVLKLALEEIICGFDGVASILLTADGKHTEAEKDNARKIISTALQHDFAKQSVDLYNWIRKSVSPLRRFDMKKRFFIFGILLGEADLWQLIEGSFRNSDGPQEDMLSVALSIIQDLVPFRRDPGLCSPRVARKRVETLLEIASSNFQQYRQAFDSNLAQCLGMLVGDLDLGELSADLPNRICERLVSLMVDNSDAGVAHACSWALSQLLSRWSIADEDLRHRVREQCCEIQYRYMSEAQAHHEATSILDAIRA